MAAAPPAPVTPLMGALPMECLIAVGPGRAAEGDAAPSCTPVYRNVACDPDLPLVSVWEGRRTLLETFELTLANHPNNPFMGTRPKDAAGNVAGRYHFQTYWECSQVVQWIAKSLYAKGVRRGARVGILGPNAPSWVQAMVACSKAAAICVPLYPTFGKEAMAHVVSHSGMEVAFVHASSLKLLLSALSKGAQQQAAGSSASSSSGSSWRQASDAAVAGSGGSAGRQALRLLVIWGADAAGADVVQACEALSVEVMVWEDFLQAWGEDAHRTLDFERAMQPPGPEDLCTIMYTSGTTGSPKGVMLTHRAMISALASQLAFKDDPWSVLKVAREQQRLQADPATIPMPLAAAEAVAGKRHPSYLPKLDLGTDGHLSYLPLAHIYERVCIEGAILLGAKVGFWQGSVSKLQDDAQALRPAMMVGVPRVWERVRESTWAKLNARTPIARFLFRWFSRIKLRRVQAGVPQHKAFWLGDLLVFRKVKAGLGGRLKLAVSGAAPLSVQAEEFMRVALCCVAGQGYGLTETCSATCIAWPDRWEQFQTVGPVQTCVEFRLASVPEMGYEACPSDPGQLPRGEICLRGPCLFSGYYRDEAATNEAVDKEGFFHTGDIGQLEPCGALRIIDRKKNLIKLAQGEYIAVERIESVMRDCPLVAQAWVTAAPAGRRLMAVVVPRFQALLAWAAARQLPEATSSGAFAGSASSVHGSVLTGLEEEDAAGGAAPAAAGGGGAAADDGAGGMQPLLGPADKRRLAQVCSLPAARLEVLAQARDVAGRAGLTGFEMVHAVRLVPFEWTSGNGLLTPTHKLVRHQLRRRFATQVHDMSIELGDT